MTIENFEHSISSFIKKRYHWNLEPISFPNKRIPNYILLDRTRNIHSYFVFCRNSHSLLESKNWEANNMPIALTQIIQTQFSELDRPLFFVIQDEDSSLKIIEGNIIREKLLNGKSNDLVSFLLSKADHLHDVAIKISREL